MACALSLSTGCPADDAAPSDDGGNDSSGTAGGTMDAETNGGSGMMTVGGSDDTMGVTTDEPATTDGGGSSSGGDEPKPDGGMCTEDVECISENCYVAGQLGGICGECNGDDDCEFGCSAPNPLNMSPSVCNMGELGGGCETTEVCEKGLECANIIDVPGVFTANTCSECSDDAGCTDKELPSCQPTYSVLDVSGHKTCVGLASIPDGEGCDMETGGEACVSGFCATADLLGGLLQLGVCSGCVADEDCTDGQVCAPPEIDPAQGLIAGGCVDPK